MPRETDTRVRILKYIRDFVRENGYPPTVREVQKAFGLASPRPVQYHLERLERDGLIEHVPLKSRGIRLPGGGSGTEEVPLLGTIAAGEPIPVPTQDTWQSIPLETVEVPSAFLRGKKQVYALRVKGTSMIDALVDDGDIVIMEAASTADDGEMVAAWLTDRQEATLKRLYREPGRIRLQPANQSMEPIYVDPDNIEVQGRVIAVLRKVKKGARQA